MPDPDLDGGLPLARRLAAHRPSAAQLVVADLVMVVAVTVLFEFFMSRQPPRLAGTGWDTAGWAAYTVAAGVTLLRRRLPRTTLAAVLLVAAEVSTDGPGRVLPPTVGLSAYRIVQEALTNVARHAGPGRAWVRISYRPDEVIIEVDDEGPGAPAPEAAARVGGGHGLIGMRERAALEAERARPRPAGDDRLRDRAGHPR